MHALCEDDSVIGSAFYIMDHIEGRNFDQPSLPDVAPEDRGPLIDAMNRTLVAIHSVDLDATGLADYGPPATTANARPSAGPSNTAPPRPRTSPRWTPSSTGFSPTCPR